MLRFHFSLFLLPVFLFSLAAIPEFSFNQTFLVFLILHGMVYPSSNGYNSYMDRDTSSIGGLKNPLQPTRQLYYVTLIMDVMAVLLSLWVNLFFALGILLYILASRAYSYRRIRLKQFPITGFLTVFVFQGAWIFFICYTALNKENIDSSPWLPCLISSMLIGALYPLTQIYQHEEDRRDGVETLSAMLGKRGSFVFSGLLFLSATILFWWYSRKAGNEKDFQLFLIFNLPVVLFFLYWMHKVWKQGKAADFKNSLRMNVIATLCMTAFFTTLLIRHH